MHKSLPGCVVSTPQGGTSKPASGSKPAAGGISTGGVGVGLEEDIKKLQRAQKFGKLSEADEKKLQGLQRKLDAQKEKQRLALDKVCMSACMHTAFLGGHGKPDAARPSVGCCTQTCKNKFKEAP